MPSGDRTYVAQVVAARTGLSQADAEKRVSDIVAQAKDAKEKAVDAAKAAAEAARKTRSMWLCGHSSRFWWVLFLQAIWRPWRAEFAMICPFPANPRWTAALTKNGGCKICDVLLSTWSRSFRAMVDSGPQ